MQKRISWDEYFISIVKLIAQRATCPRKHVGALIVKKNKIISSGYNGAPKGMEHCTDVGCLMKDGHCIRVLHAEQNAILQAGEKSEGATLYCTCLPCEVCFKMCIQVGIKKIIYLEDYNQEDLKYWIKNGGIEIQKWKS